MAEFAEVMRQATRMCDTYELCNEGCPWRGKPAGICRFINGSRYTKEQFERAVMHWAQEHPEPQEHPRRHRGKAGDTTEGGVSNEDLSGLRRVSGGND